jgi:hypothetical protein
MEKSTIFIKKSFDEAISGKITKFIIPVTHSHMQDNRKEECGCQLGVGKEVPRYNKLR